MNTVTVNGRTITSNRSITVINNRVIIDGEDVTPDSKNIIIEIQGNVNELSVDACSKITVTGDAKTVKTKSGDVDIGGNVSGNIQTMSGDVDVSGDVGGDVSTMSGDVRCRSMKRG